MTRIPRPLSLLTGLALMTLAGCESFGNPIEVLKQKKPAPDEFQVLARKELRMPEGLGGPTLPTPQPGLASPLEPDPQADAIAALGGRAAPQGVALSRGEAVLLQAAGADAVSPDVREALARENAEIEANKPYVLPTIFELFGGGSDLDPAIVLDATGESQRLQTSGVLAPVDPNARADTEPTRTSDAPISYYPSEAFGKAPRNTFTTPNVTPPADAAAQE